MNPTNRSTKDDIEDYLRPTLHKEGLTKYTIHISGNTEKGDGYLSDITFVTVEGTDRNDEKKIYHFVVKCGKKSKDFREMMPVKSAFENEIHFYNEILPAFIKFQAEKGVKEPFNHAPKCYGTLISEDMEVLILGNIKNENYVLHNRKVPMNEEHITKVIKTYGKLHAISFALRDQNPDLLKKLGEKLADVFKLSKPITKSPEEFNFFSDIIDLAKKEGNDEIIEKANILNHKARTMHDITDPTDPFAVILHGDCWNNNFMFKYEGEQRTTPSNVCLLDFQISRLASPVYDLSYFLFTSMSGKNMADFDKINNLYYESFSDSLRNMGSDPNKMFPFEELMDQWKKFSLFGLIMMPGLIRACVSDTNEVIDLVEAAETGKDITEMLSNTIKDMDQYRDRTLPVMKLAIEKGFV